MKTSPRIRTALVLLALLTLVPAVNRAAEPLLRSGDLVAICGDSITEQKLYSVAIADYLLMCQPATRLRSMQFGWSGETAPGFLARMQSEVVPFQPTVATTCYGMNDGGYGPMSADKGQRYRDATAKIVQQFKQAGVRLIVVGSPGCVDADTFRNSPEQATVYNATLAALRDIAREVAEQEGVVFANVHDPMIEVMGKAKAKYGKTYHVGGGDGVHPGPNGHLVMAYAFLKALGCDGDIGTITLDLAGSRAEATHGHQVLSFQEGSAEIESARYPFCFYGDPASPQSTRGLIEFFPFNDELNRFRLVVKNAKAARLKVTWGEVSKDFPAEQLAKGINLAAEFLDNPFSEPFRKVHDAVQKQQSGETVLVKTMLHSLPLFLQQLPEEKEAIERLHQASLARGTAQSEQTLSAMAPVRHSLKVEAAD